jgi:diguanylate cyclase (GGDEF)-like protein
MIDVDHFKHVNDVHGHSVGDQVLVEVAHRLTRALRGEDAIGRWGGEEFVVVAEQTPPEGAARLGERLRDAVASAPIDIGNGHLSVTVSVGVACSLEADAVEDLVEDADRAMYEAKSAGRDVVVVA